MPYKKRPPKEKSIISTIETTKNGPEIKITARELSFDQKKLFPTNANPNKKEKNDITVKLNKKKLRILLGDEIIDRDTYNSLLKSLNNLEKKQIIDEANEIEKLSKAMRNIISKIDLINSKDKISDKFKRNIGSPKESIGVVKTLMDRINYLPQLLKKANLIYPQEKNGTFEIRSTLSNDKKAIGEIGLEHILQYKENETPETIAKGYISDMFKGALKVFLAYWSYANKIGAFAFPALTINIMREISKNRKSNFSAKDYKEFWRLTKLLEATKLTITVKNKNKYITVPIPLLTISARVKDKKNKKIKDECPSEIFARVLDPVEFEEKADIATKISKGTLKLRREDILLALTLQTRASQTQKRNSSKYKEKDLLERGNIKIKSPQMRTKRLKEKMDRIEKAEAIGSYEKTEGHYIVKKRKTINKES